MEDVFETQQPLVDSFERGIVRIETRAPVEYLSAAFLDVLAKTTHDDAHIVLVSDENTVLTEPLRQILVESGNHWVIREESGGLRDGFTGRYLAEIADVINPGPIIDPSDISPRFLREWEPTHVQILLSASVRYRATTATLLGGCAEIVTERVTGARPTGWGPSEPVSHGWDRQALTEQARSRMPADSRFVIVGDEPAGGVLSLRVARTDIGLEELTQGVVGCWPLGTDADAAIAAVPAALSATHRSGLPTMALALARPSGTACGAIPFAQPSAVPIAVMVGGPAAAELGLDAEGIARLGGRRVGRPGLPAALFSLVDVPESDRLDRLYEIVAGIDRGRLQGFVRAHFG